MCVPPLNCGVVAAGFMTPPIIEVRKNNLFVLMDFDGVLTGNSITTRHNFRGNHTQHVIDSNGALWVLNFQRTDHSGLRKAVSTLLWNISSDYYTFASFPSVTIEAFRRIVEPHLKSENPDTAEQAASLLEPLAGCPPSDELRSHIALLNL